MSVSRRGFLRGLAGATLALPLLPSLARADGLTTPPRRFIFLFSSNGQRRDSWFPSRSVSWNQLEETVREAPLSSLPEGGLSEVLGPHLDRYREKLLLVRGLDFHQPDAFGHFPPKALSGVPRLGQYAVTIDQIMAQSSAVYPTTPYARSLHLTVQGEQAPEDPVSISDYGGFLTQVRGEVDPWRAYQSLFNPGVPGVGASASRLERRQRVLDLVKGQLDGLRNNPRLGSEDRARLDAHTTFVHELEGRLAQGLPPEVTNCGFTPTEQGLTIAGELGLPALTRAHLDLTAAAIRCDLTRIATVELCPGTDSRWFRFLRSEGFGDDHHNLSHVTDGSVDDALRQFNSWYSEQVGYLLEQLDVVEDPETGRTYLDNSIVVWGNEFGCNAWHACNAMPILIAGGGGALKMGRYLDYRRHGVPFERIDGSATGDDSRFDWAGRQYNHLLVSLLQAMGVTPAEYQRGDTDGFGDWVGIEDDWDRNGGLRHLLFA